MKKVPVSGYVITHNEAHQIKACLECLLPFCDEVVVGDMGSTDGTADIAREMGARIIEVPRANFACPVRDEVVQQLKNDWVYWIDADERLPQKAAERIVEIMSDNPKPAIYLISAKQIIFGKRVQHCGITNVNGYTTECRFFHRSQQTSPGNIHNSVRQKSEPIPLWRNDEEMDAFAYEHLWSPTINHYIYKMARYTNSEHEANIKKGYSPNWHKLFTSPIKDFISRYFMQKGYKDGAIGFEFCLMASTYQFYRILKSRHPDRVGDIV